MKCWVCNKNEPCDKEVSEDYLGDDGSKPCCECLENMQKADDLTLDFE